MTTLPVITTVETMAEHFTVPFARGSSTLSLALVSNDATGALVAKYDFSNYRALFNQDAQPRYILTVLQDIVMPTEVTISYAGNSPATSGNITLQVPAGTLARTSLALDLNGHIESDIRLQSVTMSPPAANGDAATWWGVKALLGNLAKLLWVLSEERNHIRRHLEIVQTQSFLPAASDFSLDLLGYDLGVPRFPPRPYSFDPTTVALYHMDDVSSVGTAVSVVEDSMKRYPGKADHAGTNTGQLARSGAVGRFDTALAFDNPGAEIVIAPHSDFDFAATDSFTIECFVKPADDTVEGDVLAKSTNPSDTTKIGWALSIGLFGRGLSLNTRFLVSDGTNHITLFGDQSLSSDRFYHVAGVVDRNAKLVRLYVDGRLQTIQSSSALGAIINTEPIRIGRTPGAAYRGSVDEVRLSRVALAAFHPVLGEDDEAYRGRLKLFERWTLPTPAELLRILNEAVNSSGGIQNDPAPLILNDNNAPLLGGTLSLTIQIKELAAGHCIDGDGNKDVREAVVCGTAADETTFDPLYLVNHDDIHDARVTYEPQPLRVLKTGELPPDSRKMQVVTERQLVQLLDLLDKKTLLQGTKLQIIGAFDPRANDLRMVGRGLLLSLSTIITSQLAALAHEAGFSFVCNRNDINAIYVSSKLGDYLQILGTTVDANGFSMRLNDTVTFTFRPTLPLDTLYRWEIITGGAGRGDGGRNNLSTFKMTATAPGILTVKIEATHRTFTLSATLDVRIGPVDVADGTAIASDGSTQGVTEAVAGEVGMALPTYLVTHNNALVTYGTSINNHRMQRSVAQHLDQLASLTGAGLQVLQAYMPGAVGLAGVGRALTLSHTTLSAGALAVLAHASGFSYVKHQGNQVSVLQSADDQVAVVGPQEVLENSSISLSVQPQATPQSFAIGSKAIYTANSGTDSVSEITLDTANPTIVKTVRAFKTGWAPVAVVLSPDEKRLYTADSLGNTVTAIDVTTGSILASIAVQQNPVALIHHPTRPSVYVLCHGGNALQEININTLIPGNPLAVGTAPNDMALTPDGTAIWIALSGAPQHQVAIVSTNPLALTNNITLTQQLFKIAISPDGKQAYVTQPTNSSIAILDVVAKNIINPSVDIGANTTTSPGAITVSPDSSTVYVTDTTPKNERLHIMKSDGTPAGPVSSVRVRQNPLALAILVGIDPTDTTKKKTYVLVANSGSSEVSVIDPVEVGVASTWQLGSGLGESLNWVLRTYQAGQAHLSSTTASVIDFFGDHAGPAMARAIYTPPGNMTPYTFEIRLNPTLEAAGAIIRKEQYDLIMNILNAFHPIGVEVLTRAIREHVIEVREGQLDAFPDYTYPNFRVRSQLPRRLREE